MVTAMTAWTLQKLSNGRFALRLESQVRARVQRRFGMGWSPAGLDARVCAGRPADLGPLAERP